MTPADIWVLTPDGERAFKGGEPMTVDGLVSDYLTAHPYLVKRGMTMTDHSDPVVAMTAALEAPVTGFEDAMSGEGAIEADLAAWVKEQADRYQEMPHANVVERKREQLRATWAAKAAGALTKVDLLIREKAPAVVEAAERAAVEPADVVTAWGDRASHSASEYFALCALDVQLAQHWAAELKAMPWPEIKAKYEKKVTSRDLRDVAFVAAVERADATGALNRPGSPLEDVVILKQLGDTIRATRQGRIPEPVRTLRGLIERGRALSQHGHQVKGLPHFAPEVPEPVKG